MKKIFYTLLLAIISLTIIQAQDGLIGAIRFTASIGNFTPHSTYDYVGTVGNIGSTGFTVNNIEQGAYLLDDNSLYYIDSVDIVVANNVATIWVTDLNGVGAPVSGRGQITQGGSNFNLLPVTQHGSNFITAEQTAKLLTHNFMVIDSLMGEFGVNLGNGDQLLISNRTLDFDDKTYTWDLRDTNLDEDTWTVLTKDGQSYGFFTGDGAGDLSLKFDALISGDYRNLIRSDRFLDIFIGNSTDTVNIVGKTLILDLSALLTDDNNTANVLSYDPISKQIKLTDISNVGINPSDTLFFTKIDDVTTPINVKDTLVFDFDNTISVNDTLFYVEANNTVTATMKGDTLFFGLGGIETTTTTLQEAIDAQETADGGGYLYVEFPSGAELEDDGGSLGLRGEALTIGRSIDNSTIIFGNELVIEKDASNTDGWLLQGYGEDGFTGIGGDYSSLRPDAIVPKAYIDSKIFEGVTDHQDNFGDSETMKGFRNYAAGDQIEAFSGVNNREELTFAQMSATDLINSESSYITVSPNNMSLQSDLIAVNSDNSIFSGIEYANDYSANYTDRSLVDKAYVDAKTDTIILTINAYKGNETVVTGDTPNWLDAYPQIEGASVIAIQYSFREAHTGGTIDVQMTDTFVGWGGLTIADGDRVATLDLSATPHIIAAEEILQPFVSSIGASTPPEGFNLTFTIVK